MSVPFIDLKRFEDSFLTSWMSKVEDLSRNTKFVGGDEVNNLENTLKQKNGVQHAITCANGTDAIQLALRAAGVGPGDKVLIPDSTFWATFEAVVNVGATPITVDINSNDLQMDFNLFRQGVEQYKPKAAILVHLYGWASADTKRFRDFCTEQKIILVEDGAQCYGVELNGESIYKNAFLSTISFYPAKVIGAAGDGGAVLTNDPAIAERVRSLSNHGREQHYAHGLCGWNSRMDTLQAAFLNLGMVHFEKRLKSRREIAERYRTRLKDINVTVKAPPAGVVENGYLNVTLHEPGKRDKLVDSLKAKGIGYGIVYPGAVSDQKGAQGLLGGKVGGENTRKLCSSVLSLPLFPYMKNEEFEEVISAVQSSI